MRKQLKFCKSDFPEGLLARKDFRLARHSARTAQTGAAGCADRTVVEESEKGSEISPLLSILNHKFVHELRTQEKQTTWF
jgi:hypothetical protein